MRISAGLNASDEVIGSISEQLPPKLGCFLGGKGVFCGGNSFMGA
jgi:hypothetical protein